MEWGEIGARRYVRRLQKSFTLDGGGLDQNVRSRDGEKWIDLRHIEKVD